MRVLQAVIEHDEVGATVTDAHRALIRGNRWAALWELQALEAIGLVQIDGTPADEDPKALRVYKLADAYEDVCESVGRPLIFSPDKEDENVTNGEATDTFAHLQSEVA